ncbi:MAG TPA: hypothetical protein VFX53_04620 [Pedococcus sp.]|nr:hypothetical protein [Pedococcus sp.]
MSKTRIPAPPGSLVAISRGCRCPRRDNNQGRGADRSGRRYWIAPGCPLHGIVSLGSDHEPSILP